MMHPPLDPIADQAQRDWTIAERLDQIEFMLKFVPLPWYREELTREFLALTTDPEERHEHR